MWVGLDHNDAFLHVLMRPSVNKFHSIASKGKLLMTSFTLRLKVFSENINLDGKNHSLFPLWQRYQLDSLQG